MARRDLLHPACLQEIESPLPVFLLSGPKMRSAQDCVKAIQAGLGPDMIHDSVEARVSTS